MIAWVERRKIGGDRRGANTIWLGQSIPTDGTNESITFFHSHIF
jgi:hypothetical protein